MVDAKTIVDAFHRTGIRPAKGKLFDLSSNTACAIGVLYLEKHKESINTSGVHTWFIQEFKVSFDFAIGLANAFDGHLSIPRQCDSQEDYMRGYTVGEEVSEIMFKDKKND